MADLLTHVLVPFIVLVPVSWRVEWLDRGWISVAMGGAAIPDLEKLSVVLDPRAVESLLGYPFTYEAISSLGGVLLIGAVIALAFADARRRAYAFLVFGGLTALVIDGMRAFADGTANPWLYPFSYARIPTPSLYVTSDWYVPMLSVALAVLVVLLDRYRPWERVV